MGEMGSGFIGVPVIYGAVTPERKQGLMSDPTEFFFNAFSLASLSSN